MLMRKQFLQILIFCRRSIVETRYHTATVQARVLSSDRGARSGTAYTTMTRRLCFEACGAVGRALFSAPKAGGGSARWQVAPGSLWLQTRGAKKSTRRVEVMLTQVRTLSFRNLKRQHTHTRDPPQKTTVVVFRSHTTHPFAIDERSSHDTPPQFYNLNETI